MESYNNLELNILSCLLIKPDLMNELIIEDKHFVKHQRLWQFMKAFYKKFGTFDVQLMYSVCKDKWHIVNYMQWLLELEPTYKNFNLYQQQLIALYKEDEKEKIKIDLIYQLANDLYLRNITLDSFKQKANEIIERNE